MNAPNRYELFVLEDGEKPCVFTHIGMLSISDVVMQRRDHGGYEDP